MTQPLFKKYHQAVRYLERLASSAHDQAYMHNRRDHPEQYVERTRELIKRLLPAEALVTDAPKLWRRGAKAGGNPLSRGVRVIHVAGTAGKGTTTTYLHNILYCAGYRVGSFMSPYATTSIEKIRVNGKLIDPDEFARIVEKLKPVIRAMGREYEYGRPSYFEIFFAIALLYFKKMRCEYVVLEVGCGGRYDPGMIFPRAIAAITNIGLDHTQLLGKTIPTIAKEKAGIIRKNSHLFTTEKRPSILKLFKNICKQNSTKMHAIKEEPHNEALATAIAKHLKISNGIINSAISETSLPCRFETMQQNPLVILDGAHNPMKIANVVHNVKRLTYATLYTMFGASAAKDAKRMIRELAKVTDAFVFTQPAAAAQTFFRPSALARLSGSAKKRVEPNPRRALQSTLKKLTRDDCLLITGSFYLAGELRKRWVSEQTVLTKRNHV